MTLEDFTDQLFDTILDTNFQHLELEKLHNDIDYPNQVDKNAGIINLFYDNKKYEITIKEVEEY